MRRLTFRRVLSVVLGVFAGLPILVIAGGFHLHLARQLEAEITQKNQLLARSVAGQIETLLYQPLDALRIIDSVLGDRAYRSDGGPDLSDLISDHEGIESVFVLDSEGRIVNAGVGGRTAAADDIVGLSMKGKQYYREAVGREQPFWSDVFSTMLTGRPSLAVSFAAGGGVLVGIFNIDWLDKVIQGIGAAVGVEIMITDRKGVMIVSADRDVNRQFINLSSIEAVKRGLAGEEGTFLYDSREGRRLGSVARIPQTGWLIIVSQSYESAFAPLYRLRNLGIGGIVLGLIAAMAAAMLLARQITKPLLQLARQARHIGLGRHERTVPRSGYSEIDTLADEFTEMAEEIRKRESALRDSEERLRAIVDGSPAAITLKDLDGRYILVNEAYARMTGRTVGEFIGKDAGQTRGSEFAERSRWSDQETVRTGRPVEFEYWDRDENGNIRYFLVNKFPVRDSAGQVRAIGMVSTDVTDLKRAETELRGIAESVSGAVGVDFFRKFVHQISATLEMDIALIARQGPDPSDAAEVVAMCVDGEEMPPSNYPLPGTPCKDVLAGELCVFQGDLGSLFPEDERLRGLGADSFVGTPLVGRDGAVIGLIAVLKRESIQNPNRIVPILKIFAARAAAELERLDVEENLRRSEGHYRKLFDGMVSGCAVQEIICNKKGRPVDYRFLDVNPAFEKITGLSKIDLVGRRAREVLPNIEDYWIEAYGRVAKNGESTEFEQYSSDLQKYFQVSAFSPRSGQVAVSIHDVSERQRAEVALRESERDLRGIFDNMLDTFVRVGVDGTIILASPSFERIFGVPGERAVGRSISDFLAPGATAEDLIGALDASGRIEGLEVAVMNAVGLPIWVSITANRLTDEFGDTLGYEGIIRDVTGRKATEDALRRSQRLEAVGQLTGGIAHDFNNMLGVIIGNLDLLKELCDLPDFAEKRVSDALHAAWRGADLTKRLLAFSRRGPSTQHLNDVNVVLASMTDLLARMLTEQIEMTLKASDEIWPAGFDAGAFEDAILNLVLNARDAMPSGGTLVIETSNVTVDEKSAVGLDCRAGDYVRVKVADTGVGMDRDVLDRVFEPFFTTKDEGRGTGLGLSMVYGFVRRCRGAVHIDSEPGKGTSVSLYLPRGQQTDEESRQPVEVGAVPSGTETVLLVDDAEAIREVTAEYLSRQGYEVLQAADGKQALGLLDGECAVDFLLSDIVMPGGISGEDLAVVVRERFPEMPILLTSGFIKGKAEARPTIAEVQVIPKPYRLEDLARRIRELLDTAEPKSQY